jgi:hypothetical protein
MTDRSKIIEPCIDCLCVPVCKTKDLYKLNHDCSLMLNFFIEIQCNIPRNSYRFVYIQALHRTYEGNMLDNGKCVWKSRNFIQEKRS